MMAWVFNSNPASVAVGVLRFTRKVPGVPLSVATVNPVGIPSLSRPGNESLADLIATPETMVLDFLAGIEIEGVGVLASTGTAQPEDPATGPDAISDGAVGFIVTPSRPVIELKPRKAVITNSNERATLEDF